MAPESPDFESASEGTLPTGGIMPLAYLNTEYPSLSHTFIEREVRALRERGLKITTFSVRKPGRHSSLGTQHAAAAAETVCLLDSTALLATAFIRAAITSPLRVLLTLVRAQRLAPPGVRSRLRHAICASELRHTTP